MRLFSFPLFFRRILLSVLLLSLVVPAGELSAWAQDQSKDKQGKNQSSKDKQARPDQTGPGFSISVTVPVVSLDVVVTDNNGNYLKDLKKENFRVTEDGTVQTISSFAPSEAPITIVLLLEFSKLGYEFFAYNARNWSAAFLGNLKPNDWIALESFNMRSTVEVDFTHNRDEIMQGLYSMVFPPFSESNLFDALSDVLDRTKDVKGKKAVLVLASGIDTFSKLTLDETLKRIRETDATIFTVGVGEQLFINQAPGRFGQQLTYIQAQNQLKTFAAMTGGRSWLPRFDGEIPSIMQEVAASLRNQYSLSYSPTNETLDGKYRKIKVELVAPDGGPLTVMNEKNKKVKFVVYARQGYTAPKSNVETK
ncbi:MAG TPA: VWA domain-containing protein [Candidatus Acidoferrales bacterium]|jgi:VWFA-related protein|nr:VWA domain-containing protein [Candidatus Acidoferrales bacterium]